MAKIANVALTNTFNTWRTNSNIAFDRLSQFAIDSRTLYANTIIANNVLRASGNTVLGGALKRTIVNGLFSANGQVTIGTNLTVSGNTSTKRAPKRPAGIRMYRENAQCLRTMCSKAVHTADLCTTKRNLRSLAITMHRLCQSPSQPMPWLTLTLVTALSCTW